MNCKRTGDQNENFTYKALVLALKKKKGKTIHHFSRLFSRPGKLLGKFQ